MWQLQLVLFGMSGSISAGDPVAFLAPKVVGSPISDTGSCHVALGLMVHPVQLGIVMSDVFEVLSLEGAQ